MDEREFEKQDDVLMRELEKMRGQKMPDHLLKDFTARIEQEILQRQTFRSIIGMSFGVLIIAAIVLSGVAYLHLAKPVQTVQEPEEQKIPVMNHNVPVQSKIVPEIKKEIQKESLSFPAGSSLNQHGKVRGPMKPSSFPHVSGGNLANGSPTKSFGDDKVKNRNGSFQENEISDEIIALEEIGVWTEEDNEAINIPMEDSFTEIENGFDQDTVQMPVVAR